MKSIGYHIRLRLRHDRVIAPDTASRRALARVVFEKAADAKLLAFAAADTHAHIELVSDRQSAGELARRIEIAAGMILQLDVGFATAYFRPIHDQHHLLNTFVYILKQDSHHELSSDPFREASNLPDLLGLRLTGQFTRAHVRSFLPRVRRRHLLQYLGVEELSETNAHLDHVAEAAAAALALPDLNGQSQMHLKAKRAALHVVGNQIPPGQLARMLGTSTRTLRRLRHEAADGNVVKAIRLQLALRWQKMENDL